MLLKKIESNWLLALIQKAREAINSEVLQDALKAYAPMLRLSIAEQGRGDF